MIWILAAAWYFLVTLAAFGLTLWVCHKYVDDFDIWYEPDVWYVLVAAVFWPLLLIAAPFAVVYYVVRRKAEKH